MQQIKKIADETKRTEGFLWTMAHEIRTPLNSIVGFCDVFRMMGNEMSETEKEQIVQGIESNNELLEKIVEDMDGYSRAVSKEVVYEKESVDVAALIEEIYTENKSRFEKQDLTFYLASGRSDVYVKADRGKLKAAFIQLVDNALKFTKKGSVSVGWEYNLENANVELFVEDTGVGIHEEDLPLIYDMFWKKDTFIPGVGIGLALSKTYVEAMGGKLSVVSEYGVGSRFVIILKVMESA
jgi:signal transduction histidine kinase